MKQRYTEIFNMHIKNRGIRLFTIILLISLMSGMLASCATVSDEITIPPSYSNEDQETRDPPSQEDPDPSTETDASYTIKTDSGSYVGQVDNNSIEIRISGVQDDEMAFRVYKISDEVRSIFESLSLNENDEVKFSYYQEEIGQPVLVEIERIKN